MTWLTLTLASAVCLGLYDVAKKAALRDNPVLPVLLLSTLSGFGLLLVELGLAASIPSLPRFELEPLSPAEHGRVMVKSGIVTASWVLTFFAIKHLPLSLATPIRASAPLFTVLGALALFGERPLGRQWLGMASVLAAYLAFSAIGKREGIVFRTDRWVGFLFLGTLIGAASGLYDKYLLQELALPPFTLQFWFTVYGAGLQLGLWWWFARGRAANAPLEFRGWIVLVGSLLVVADQFYFEAVAREGALISVVSVLRRSNVLVSFAFGALLFRERLLGQKALALAGVLVGLVLLLRH
ncbi:MAG TPA: EamA family transporter [Polyangiaceae bacterium]|nr:EamA family transporter [Polyangiaceae bacterium]